MSLESRIHSVAEKTALFSLVYLLISQLILAFFFESQLLVAFTQLSKFAIVSLASSSILLILKNEKIIEVNGSFRPAYLLFCIFTLGILVRGWSLGLHNFFDDEHQVIGAANCYYEIGEFCYWDWINDEPAYSVTGEIHSYNRAWPHTWLISQSFRIFGVSEASSRIPSLIFGGLTILLVYGFAIKFTSNKFIAILAALLAAISPEYVFLSRYARMYSILMPIFIVQIWLAFDIIEARKLSKAIISKALLLAALTAIGFIIHINSLSFSIGIFLYLLVNSAIYSTRHYKIWLAITTLFAIAFYFTAQVLSIDFGNYYFSLFSQRNFGYISFLFDYPFTRNIGLLFFILAIISSIKMSSKKLLFLVCLILSNITFFVFVARRYEHFNYTAHLTPIVLIILLLGFQLLLSVFKQKSRLLVITLSTVFILATNLPKLIDQHVKLNGRPNYDIAYREIVENYNPELDVLYLQFPRDYYLRNLENVKIINLGTNSEYSLDDFLFDLGQNPRGWLGWTWYKRGHVDNGIRVFAEENLEKIHGEGVDFSGVELYKIDIKGQH